MPCPDRCLCTLGTNVNGRYGRRDGVFRAEMKRARSKGKKNVPLRVSSTLPMFHLDFHCTRHSGVSTCLWSSIRTFHWQCERSQEEDQSRQVAPLWPSGKGTPPCFPRILGFSFCSVLRPLAQSLDLVPHPWSGELSWDFFLTTRHHPVVLASTQ